MARIVVADDEGDIRRLIAFTLRRRGHEVFEAADGTSALETVRGLHPDLAVLDVMMPGMDGLEVARALAADEATHQLPVLIVSAGGQPAALDEGQVGGARAYLEKPFAPQDLAAHVDALLRQSRPSQ